MNTPQDNTYYKATDYESINKFITSNKYIPFKDEYNSAIDSIIVFYSNYAEDEDKKNIVKAELNKFKNRLFGNNAVQNAGDKALSVLFEGKEAMESIAQALIPEEGSPFESEEIKWKLIHIFNLAGKNELFEQSSCMVCAPGTVRNLIETAQLLRTNIGNLIDKAKTQRKIIITDIIKKYIFITHNKEIRQRVGGAIHDTNLMNAFVNALDKKLGLEQVNDVYAIKSSVTKEDIENINHEIKLTVTEDNITEQLAQDYLSRVNIEINPEKDQFIDYNLARDTLEKLKFAYGDYSFYDVFTINDNNEILGTTKAPTAIKVAMLHLVKQDPTINMYPLTWSTDTLISDNAQGKKLWRSGDLFWTELTDEYKEKTILLPSAQELGKEYINNVGYSQLYQIIEQSSSLEDATLFFYINPTRLETANREQLTLFFSKLDADNSLNMAIRYAHNHKEWFDSLVNKIDNNPLATLLMTAHMESNTPIADWPPIALEGLSVQQAEHFLSELDSEDTGATKALKFVTEHSQWFTSTVNRLRTNPLLPILLARLSPQELADWPPIALEGLSVQQAEHFLSELDSEDTGATKALKFVTEHSQWFTSTVNRLRTNPLLPILLARLSPQELAAWSPKGIVLKGLSAQQIEAFLFALASKDNDVDNAINYFVKYPKWFRSKINEIGKNPLLPILLKYLPGNKLMVLSPTNPLLYHLTIGQLQRFLSALDPEGSGVTNAIDYFTKHLEWFEGAITFLKYNPLFPLILERLDNNQLLALAPDIVLSGLSAEQATNFFFRLDPESSARNSIGYVTKYQYWFKALVDKIGENPLIPVLLTHLNQEERATLIPEIALYNPSKQQTKEFLAALDGIESKEITNALAYVNKHKAWFNTQVIRTKENPLIELMISRYSSQQLAEVTPDHLAFKGLNKFQAEIFLFELDKSKEHSITQALAYATKYKAWFNTLLEDLGENPLTWFAQDRLSGEQLSKLPPDSLALKGIRVDQARDFFSALIKKNNNDITIAKAYASQHQEWFDNLIKEHGENPLTYIVALEFPPPQLVEIDPTTDISLRGLSAIQATVFLHQLDPDSRDITEALRYVTLHNEWFFALVKRTKQNPLIDLLLRRITPEELAISNVSNIALKDMSVEQSHNFFNFLVHNSNTDITPALEYATRNRAWFNALLEDIGENPLTWLIMKRYSPQQLAELVLDNIVWEGLSIEQFKEFFVYLVANGTNLPRVLNYVSKHEQWFTKLVTKIGQNPLIPLLRNFPRDVLTKLKPDITLFGLSADQSKAFFAQLVDGSNFTQALIYAKTHKEWFIKLVKRTGENPITSKFINVSPGYLHLFSPDDFALWGMSARQAEVFLASMDSDDSLNIAIDYINKYQSWFGSLVKHTQENPLTPLLIARLSSEQLAKQPPEIALLGLTEHQSQDFLSRMSPENAATYIKDHSKWFDQQGWDTAALLLPRKNAPIPSDTAPFDIRVVSTWKIPEVEPLANEENTRFDGQVIIQLENDPIVRKAAAQLAGKHPKNSVIVQLDQNNDYRVVYGDLGKLEGIMRWQLVGHSRVEGEYQTLGARGPVALAEQLAKFTQLSGGASPSPEHINLVGCALAYDNTTGNYVSQFATALTEQNIHPGSISAYATKVAVNAQGQKRLTETGEKMVLTKNNEQWVMTRMQGKVDTEGAGRELLGTLNRAQNFEYAMDAVYQHNGLSKAEWLPMLHSLKKDSTQPDHYSLTFVRQNQSKTGEPPEQRTVHINDPHIPDFIREYDQHLARAKTAFVFADGQLIPRSEGDISAIDGIHGLNTAFILQTWFMQRARQTATVRALPTNLNTALQIHFYTNYTQMGVGALDDTVKFVQMSRELIQGGYAAGSSMFKAFSSFSIGAGIVLNLLSIGLDSYELAHAQNEAQRAIFGSQEAVDLASLRNHSYRQCWGGVRWGYSARGFLRSFGCASGRIGSRDRRARHEHPSAC